MFFYLESFLLATGRHFRVFVFYNRAYSNTRNPRKISIRQLIYRGIKTIYLILSTFLSILCVQDATLKVMLKIIKENLPLKLESSFSCYDSQTGTQIQNWQLFNTFLLMVTVNNWRFFYLESFLLISGISGFSFFAIEHIRKHGIHGKFP